MNDFTKEELLEFLEYYNAWSCFTTTAITNGNNTPTIILDEKNVVKLFGMNDFTKEELSIILFWGLDRVQAVGIENFTEESHLKLFHKLQDMIVNYCDHKEHKYYGDIATAECNKCGMVILPN